MAKNSSSYGGVRVMSRSLVKASAMRPRVVVAVSNLDLLYRDMPASLLCVYRKPATTAGFEDVVAAFNAKLPSLLDHFSLLAGRIVADPRSGLPEVHCDNQGAELVVAEVGVALGSLDYGDLDASLARIGVPVPYCADLGLSLQLVSFACGGFAVAWCSSHMLFDGSAIGTIIGAWAELAAGSSGTISAARPNHNRSVVFRPRDPPAYSSALGELFVPLEGGHLVNALTAGTSFVRRTYYLEERDLAALRAQAGGPRATRLEAVSAYLWKVLADVVGSSDERCRMGWWVDGRRRLTTTAPAEAMRNYIGNVTSFTVAEASVEGIKRQALPGIAAMVRESIKSTSRDEHFQELVDWVEEHKGKGAGKHWVEAATVGLGSPLLGVTSHAYFSPKTDFGFGQAVLAMPAWVDSGRLCCGFVTITTPPAASASCWILTMSIWPSLAAALDSHHQHIFKPLTAHYLGLVDAPKNSRL